MYAVKIWSNSNDVVYLKLRNLHTLHNLITGDLKLLNSMLIYF